MGWHQPTTPAGYPAGLPGAIAPTRYVGGTTGGAPLTGTFAVGDFIIDEAGYVWICTVAGSPGTWAQSARGDLVPTLSEIDVSCVRFGDISNGASVSHPLWIAPFDCKVVQASLQVWGNGQSASNTNYWDIQVRRARANVMAVIADQNTKVTGGQGISQRTDWNFDSVAFDPTNQLLQKGDAVDFAFFPTGTPSTLQEVIGMIRCEPT